MLWEVNWNATQPWYEKHIEEQRNGLKPEICWEKIMT